MPFGLATHDFLGFCRAFDNVDPSAAAAAAGGVAAGVAVGAEGGVTIALAPSFLLAWRFMGAGLFSPDAPCPCCWRVEDLQRGAAKSAPAGDAAAAAAEVKALGKARKYTGCRIWRRHA